MTPGKPAKKHMLFANTSIFIAASCGKLDYEKP
jgi:hypothetical protein